MHRKNAGARIVGIAGAVFLFVSAAVADSPIDALQGGGTSKALDKDRVSTALVQYGCGRLSSNVACSPDGTKFLSGSMDGRARIWDVSSGALLRTLAGHWSWVSSVAFSANGARVLTGSGDKTAKLWDADTGAELRTFNGHTARINAVALSADGTMVLTCSDDGKAKLWDADTGALLFTLSGHSAYVTDVAFSPDGTRALTASTDMTAKVWDTATGGLLFTFTGHSSYVYCAAFSPDGTRALTGSADSTAKVWNPATGQVISTFTAPAAYVFDVAFSPDGTKALGAPNNGTAVLWDAASGTSLRTFSRHAMAVSSVVFSPDGSSVFTGSQDNTVKLWDAGTGSTVRTFTGHTSFLYSAVFSPDGNRVLTGGQDDKARLWDAATGVDQLTFTGHTSFVRAAVFSPDGARVLTGGEEGKAKLWTTATGAELRTLTGHTGAVRAVAFSPDGTTALTGSYDNTAKLWNAGTGAELRSFAGHTKTVTSVAFSPDGARVLTGSEDGTAKAWNAETGAELRSFTGHAQAVYSVAFSPDGARVLTGSGDMTAKLWNAETGAELRSLAGHTNSVRSVAFSPDGTKVLTGAGDKTAILWDAAAGTELRAFTGHKYGTLNAVAFSADGTRVLTGSEDGTARSWPATGGVIDVAAPDVRGKTAAGAATTLANAGLSDRPGSPQCSNAYAEGLVAGQLPSAGTWVPPGAVVTVTMSTGLCNVTVPEAVGVTEAVAISRLQSAGLVSGAITRQCNNTVTAGLVFSQSLEAGAQAPFGSAVDLTVSTGLCWVTVPDLVNGTPDEAVAALTAAGLTVGSVLEGCSNTVAAGLIAGQNPAVGTEVPFGSAVALLVATSPCSVTAPNVMGRTADSARGLISGAGLTTGTVTLQCSNTVAEGLVISQNPAAGAQVSLGAAVALAVSGGVCSYAVPNVAGSSQSVAQTLIAGAQLAVGTITRECSNTVPAGSVIRQSPAAGTQALFGSVVNLAVSTGLCNVAVPSIAGQTQQAAGTLLTGANLSTGTITRQCSNTVAEGLVISQTPAAGTQAPFGSAVGMTISSGLCDVTVPNVAGQTQAGANTLLTQANLATGTVTQECSNTVAVGRVIRQSPAAGGRVPYGSTVALVVCSRPCNVPMPSVVGQTRTAAVTALTGIHLVPETTEACSNTVAAGLVISQTPEAGQQPLYGSTVTLLVSTGPCRVIVPNVVGQPQSAATTLLTDGDLVGGAVTEACTDAVAAGLVISQSPEAGEEVVFGSAVAMVVSTGPCNVAVPNVAGQTQAAATAMLSGTGLVTGTVSGACSNTLASGTVIRQSPEAGEKVAPGSAVNLVVSTGPCSVVVPNVTGQTRAAAGTLLGGANLVTGAVTGACSNTVAEGVVISQTPAAGETVTFGGAVDLVVSTGLCRVVVPNVAGQTQANATGLLNGAYLVTGAVTGACSNTVAAGVVISQTPAADETVLFGSAVDLVVSTGLCNETVPDLTGQTQAAATTLLSGVNLVTGTVLRECSDTVAEGLVITQTPAAGETVTFGGAVDLTVSAGPCAAEGEGEYIPPSEADLRALLKGEFDAMDSDADDGVSYPEALAALPGLTEAVFNAVDADRDGQVSRAEAGLDEDTDSGCAGCRGGKGSSGFGAFTKAFGDLFLGGLGLMILLASGKRRL